MKIKEYARYKTVECIRYVKKSKVCRDVLLMLLALVMWTLVAFFTGVSVAKLVSTKVVDAVAQIFDAVTWLLSTIGVI